MPRKCGPPLLARQDFRTSHGSGEMLANRVITGEKHIPHSAKTAAFGRTLVMGALARISIRTAFDTTSSGNRHGVRVRFPELYGARNCSVGRRARGRCGSFDWFGREAARATGRC